MLLSTVAIEIIQNFIDGADSFGIITRAAIHKTIIQKTIRYEILYFLIQNQKNEDSRVFISSS